MPRRTPRDACRRAFGQNFLHDQSVVADVIGTLHPPPGALVVDLGAGAGALTSAAAARAARVIAVELDPAWTRLLRSRAGAWGDVEVIAGDALRVPFPSERFYVVSSAPYGIGTKLVRRVLTDAHGLVRGVIVLQREAALRLARGGRFAASWAPWFELRVQGRIPPRAFRPVPSVESAMLTIVPRPVPLLSPAAFPAYDAFLDSVFRGRGARLADRLGDRRRAVAALAAAGVARDVTPSAVPPDIYARLFTGVTSVRTSTPGRV
jgi:23S rRNA (adenine-N6)-dimethyltransferase